MGRRAADLVQLHRHQCLGLIFVAGEVADDGQRLDNDGARHFALEPHHAEALALEVAGVVGVHARGHHVGGAPGGYDGDEDAETHGHADANLFDFLDPQIPRDQPRKESESKVGDDVVHCCGLARGLS